MHKEPPVAKTGMLIRKPVADGSRRSLIRGLRPSFGLRRAVVDWSQAKIQWEWEMYHASTRVSVKVIESNKRIVIEWDGYSGRTAVERKFAPIADGTPFVGITESGWTGDGDELMKYVPHSTEGFTWTLAGLKALLEHNLRLNLVAAYPDQ